MDFYYVNYLHEFLNNEEWEKAQPRPDKIIVIASNFDEAKNKINECINIFNNNCESDERFSILGEVIKMNGLRMFNSFHGGISCFPIHESK